MPYVPLHVHSVNSTYRGMMTTEELVEAAERKGFDSVALTDCWSTYGHYGFYRAAVQSGIKPVLGVEARHTSFRGRERYSHLTLLAENEAGYRNIVSLVQAHYDKKNECFVTPEELREFSEGIIALTGSMEGEISQSILGGSLTRMKKILADLAGIYGPDNLFIELINHNTEKEWFVCDKLIELSSRSGIPAVVTNNDRFVSRDRADDYLVLDRIRRKHQGGKDRGGAAEYYMKIKRELEPYFTVSEDALDNSGLIASRCSLELPEDFRLEFTGTADPYMELERRCRKYFDLRCADMTPEEKEEAESSMNAELQLARAGNVSSFLIFLSDLFDACRRSSIRLELLGDELQQSIISYLLGITNVEPITHGLVFECFCSDSEYFAPHLELITDAQERESVFSIVCSIIPRCRIFFRVARSDMSFKKIVEELCSVVNVDKRLHQEIIAFAAREGRDMDISSMFRDSVKFRNMYSLDRAVKTVFHLADTFRGRIRHFNLDSSRAVVLPEGAQRMITVLVNPEGEKFLQCEDRTLERLHGWPFVLHHSKVLAVISKASKSAGIEDDSEEIEERSIPLDDHETFGLIARGDTEGVYLLESEGVRKMITRIKPDNFDSFVDAVSLYRPDPLRGELWKKYLGEEPLSAPRNQGVREVLRETRGVLLYREQARKIIEEVAGLEGEEVFRMEFALKNADPAGLRNGRLNFIRNCMERGIEEEQGNRIFDFLRGRIQFTYARSLACSRAYLSYVSAYLKAHHFTHYFAALFNVYSGQSEKERNYRNYFRKRGGRILPADINRSFTYFSVEGEDIRSPLEKGEDEDTAERIVEERENSGDFESLAGFVNRIPEISEENLLRMAGDGVFDSLKDDRKEIETELLELFEKRNITKLEGAELEKAGEDGVQSKQLSIFEDEGEND